MPRITDPLAAQRAKGLARIIKYLSAIDEDGAWYDEQELDDIAALVGDRPESLATGRAVVASAAQSGALPGRDYLLYLWRRAARDNELMREASGVMAERHWPPLR